MITIKRKVNNHLNVIDKVYQDNKLQFEQSNLNSKNRFGNGKVIAVNTCG